VLLTDHTGRVQYVNSTFCAATGYSQAEMTGRAIHEFGELDSDTQVEMWNTLGFGLPWRGEFAAPRKSGGLIWVDASISPVQDGTGRVTNFIALILDITARRAAEDALRESEEKFRAIVETSREIIWSADANAIIRYVNPTVEAVLGYRPEDLVGRNARELLHPDDSPALWRHFQQRLTDGNGWSALVVRWRHQDGSWRYVESDGAPIFGPDGQLDGFTGTCRDVTAREKAEEAKRLSEERYRILYNENPSMYFTIAEDLTVLSVNQHGAGELGYKPDDLIGKSVLTVVHPQDRAGVRKQLAGVLSGGPERQSMEFRKVRKDGQVIWVKENVRATRDADGRRIVLIVCEDVTERHHMEETLQSLREELERKAERAMKGRNPYNLSFRELTILQLAGSGRSDKEISAVLGIRPLTVSKHVSNILKKMRAPSRTAASVRAWQEGLIEQTPAQ